ncbi:MAG: right-handed parallel beta-helix repeat-containing protein [bacterium]
MRLQGVVSLVVAGLAVPGLGRAAVLRVPEDYPSVLAGVDAASAGDSVLVGPGTWRDLAIRPVSVCGTLLNVESALFLKPGITVIGVAGAVATTLDSGASSGSYPSTVEHALPGTSLARLVGLTITGKGDGVSVCGASPLELVDCVVTRNGHQALGVRQADITLRGCTVSENELGASSSHDGAVFGFDYSITALGCTFDHNRGPGLVVQMSHGWGSGIAVTLQDCLFQDHVYRGVLLADVTYLDVQRCTFLRNSIAGGTNGNGGGLDVVRCVGHVSFCTFAFDSAGGGGGAEIGSNVRIERNTFYACYAGIIGGALTMHPDVGTTDNIFAYSAGRRGAVSGSVPNPASGCNLYWANAAGDYFDQWVAAPSDIHADPLFCDPVTLNFHVEAASPAAPANSHGCGLIGAHDVNCGPVSVEPTSWGRLKGLFK